VSPLADPGWLLRWGADAVLLAHAAFVAFVVLGGFAVRRWRWLAWLHLPAAAWGAAISVGGWICPLTPLEVDLRRAAGEAGYPGGFLEHYLLGVLYPEGLTRAAQVWLGLGVVAINAVAYRGLLRRPEQPAPRS